MILALRTDAPEARLVLLDQTRQVDALVWTAGRHLAAELMSQIEVLLKRNHKDWPDITGLIVYRGPGSFTGLRIGATVANTAAYSLNVPVVGASGDDWIADGLEALKHKKTGHYVVPEYGADPNITMPKH
jgi:tRNA threonylcarbamoyladenosine biosynthesis protein TsaB